MQQWKMSKDINAIITYLDTYLNRTGKSSIDPVEANEVLAKAGLLCDSKDRPGKPLRNLLRDGQLPHAFQSGGKGSSWTIPHSNKWTVRPLKIKAITPKIVTPKQVTKAKAVLSTDYSQLDKILMNENNFKSASIIDNLVPHNAGLYCIRISDINKLPKPFSSYLADRQHNIIYIGIATESLSRRFLNQELRANGHGTFFRSIGAVLGHRPLKGSLITKANKRNYKFSPTDEQKIIKWINDNLKVNWVDFNGDLESLETELITKYRPLINLAKNPSALQLLSDLRKECVQIANEL
ncbi:MAG: hypothetical protein KGO81_01020 [Bacteroidota bacterium]|nr:hypothetical protein [Bacteroidota bacterium]